MTRNARRHKRISRKCCHRRWSMITTTTPERGCTPGSKSRDARSLQPHSSSLALTRRGTGVGWVKSLREPPAYPGQATHKNSQVSRIFQVDDEI